MKYSILTASNSNNISFYKKYIKSINIQDPIANELVFIDDAIKLKGIKILLKKKLNKSIKLIYLKNNFNLGISKSLNRGLNYCKKKLIFRLDIDDSWKQNHVKTMLKEFNLNSDYFVYSNSSSFFNMGLVDNNLIIDNPTIHSSWLINLHKLKRFKYSNLYPEDYGTLSLYYRKGFKFKIINSKTVNYKDNINFFSKKKIANKNLKKIRLKNLKHYLKKKIILICFLI